MQPWGIFALYLKANKIHHPVCSTVDKIGKSWRKGLFYGNTPGEKTVKNP